MNSCLTRALCGWLAPGFLAAAALALLTYSFAVDVRWLARGRHQPLETTA